MWQQKWKTKHLGLVSSRGDIGQRFLLDLSEQNRHDWKLVATGWAKLPVHFCHQKQGSKYIPNELIMICFYWPISIPLLKWIKLRPNICLHFKSNINFLATRGPGRIRGFVWEGRYILNHIYNIIHHCDWSLIYCRWWRFRW